MHTEELLDLYKALHRGEGTYLQNGQVMRASPVLWNGQCFAAKLARPLRLITAKRASFRVLDYGCGKASYMPNLHRYFDSRIQEWYLYDPGYEKYSAPPVGTFDYVVCADVMEHVIDYEETLSNIASHLDKKGIALFSISGGLDSRSFANGLNMHVTLKSAEDWQALLKKHFGAKKVILLYNNRDYWESWHAPL